MSQVREEVCLHYLGFGMCAKGLDASNKNYCAMCDQYEAASSKKSMNYKKDESMKQYANT